MAALAGEASLPDRDPKLHAACDECSKFKVLKYIICDNYLRVPPRQMLPHTDHLSPLQQGNESSNARETYQGVPAV